jgi:ubiquitin-conjugating enzyme E2 I
LAPDLTSHRASRHPAGFYARPAKTADGGSNLLLFECGIPGKEGTDWAGGLYTLELKFTTDYPSKPPTATFKPPIMHPNVFSCGQVCLSILKDENEENRNGWRPAIKLKQILMGLQDMLDTPNPLSPANSAAAQLFVKNKSEYSKKIKAQAAKFAPST